MDFPFSMLECLGLIVVSNWQPFKDVVVAKSKFHRQGVGVLEICFPNSCLFVLKPFQMSQHENHYPGHNIALEISHLHFIFSTGVAKSVYLLCVCVFIEDVTLSGPFHCVRHTLYSLDDFTGARQTCQAQLSMHRATILHFTHYSWKCEVWRINMRSFPVVLLSEVHYPNVGIFLHK